MRSSEYWVKRAIEREKHWHDKSKETIERELADIYGRALQNIRHDIEALYGRFAVDNKLPPDKARELIKGGAYRYWRMDMESYLQQIKVSKDGKKLLLELNTLAMRSRITRLQQLYSKTLREIISLTVAKDEKVTDFLGDAYKDYYKDCVEDFKQEGLKSSWAEVDNRPLNNILRIPWSGKNYSQRIWKDAEKLSHTIRDEIANSVHRGLSVNKTAMLVKNRMNVSMSNSKRLVRTELNYVNNQAALDSIKEAGFEQYEFIATLDRRTSQICREHNGKIFPVKEAQVGTNVPPLHPNCRSTIAGSLKGDSKPKGRRAARNVDGKYIRVPADMTYREWYQQYIDRTGVGDKIFAHHDLRNGIIKANKSNIKGTAYGVNLVISKKGGKTWNFYDGNGLQYLQVSNSDHGHKKESVFGIHGEHAHWYNVDSKGILRHGKAVEIPEYVRKTLGDQL